MIVAFSGRKFSGKDTCAEGLINRHGFIRIALADRLKDIVSIVFNISRYRMDIPSEKESPFLEPLTLTATHISSILNILREDKFLIGSSSTSFINSKFSGMKLESIRHILQVVGTDICRLCISDTIWLEYLNRRISGINENFVVTDARFKNEREYLKKLGAILILVKRNNKAIASRLYPTEIHISENDLGDDSEYDVIVNNNTTKTSIQSEISMWYTVKYDGIKSNK